MLGVVSHHHWLVGALLLLGGVLAAPRAASASCGDWLTTHPVADASATRQSSTPRPLPPCTGPFCRQAPISAVPLPAPPARTIVDSDVAVLGDADDGRCVGPAASWLPIVSVRASAYAHLPPDRPPRGRQFRS